MKGNVIQMNTLHLNSVRLNGIGKVQSVSLKGGSTEDPVFPPVEPPVEPTPTYTLSASVTNGKVSATKNGSAVNLPFTANEGDTIVLEVTPNDGYSFEGWNDGNTDNPRTITMNADVVLSAQCVEVVVPSKYIQFEDPAVEAICVANWSSDGIGLTEEDAAAVTTIGTTFKGNTEITSFEEFKYFKNCTTLEASAFEGCNNLASLPIEHIVVLNSKALYGCSALEYDNLHLANCTTFGQNALYGVKAKKLRFDKLTTLPQGASASQNYGDKSVLEEVVIPEGVTSIPGYTLLGYSAKIYTVRTSGEVVRGAIFPNLTQTNVQCLQGCDVGEMILSGVTSVNIYSLQLTNITLLDLGANLTNIATQAIRSNANLSTIIVRATTPPTLGTGNTTLSTATIYVPDASVEAYKTATNWSSYASRIKGISEYNG